MITQAQNPPPKKCLRRAALIYRHAQEHKNPPNSFTQHNHLLMWLCNMNKYSPGFASWRLHSFRIKHVFARGGGKPCRLSGLSPPSLLFLALSLSKLSRRLQSRRGIRVGGHTSRHLQQVSQFLSVGVGREYVAPLIAACSSFGSPPRHSLAPFDM